MNRRWMATCALLGLLITALLLWPGPANIYAANREVINPADTSDTGVLLDGSQAPAGTNGLII